MLVLTLALAVWPLSAVRGEAQEAERSGTPNVAAEVNATEAKSQDPLDAVSHLEQEIKRYGAEYRKASDEEKKVIRGQLAIAKKAYREGLGDLVKELSRMDPADQTAAGLKSQVAERVTRESRVLRDDYAEIADVVSQLREKREGVTGEELVALEQEISRELEIGDSLVRDLVANADQLEVLSLSSGSDLQKLDELLEKRARALSGRLDWIEGELKVQAEQQAKASADDKKAIAPAVAALDIRKQAVATSLQVVIEAMRQRGMETSEYRQRLFSATGEITSDILDTGVAVGLAREWTTALYDWFIENGPAVLVKVLVVLAILFLFKFLSRVAARLVRRAVDASKLQLSQLLKEFFVSAASKAVMVVGVLVALSQLGVQVGPLLAGLGVMGFIVGFALQDTLSNFAAGLMILVYRPFDVGDFIEAGGVTGKVSQMSLVSTTVATPDNQKLVVPNNKIWGGVIRNVTAQPNRRVDMTFGIGYGDDIAKAEKVLMDLLTSHPLVLSNPEPVVKLHTLGESSVDFIVRPWTRTDDYWTVYWDITRSVKECFDAEGISIPFPQRDVHLHEAAKTGMPA